jgi:acyl carrier protein
MKSDPVERLSEIFRVVLDLPDGVDTYTLRRINEVKWDSLATVTLGIALESEFGIALDAQEIERLTSFQATLLLVQEKIDAA